MSEIWTIKDFDEEQLQLLMKLHGKENVEIVATSLSDDIYDVLSTMLANYATGGATNGFAQADLDRRRAEARMVESEAEMFSTISTQLRSAGGSGIEAFSEVAESASQLVQALAEKNATMGEGNPHPGGTTAGPRPPVETPPETPPAPPEQPPLTGVPQGCYERYKVEIARLWAQKDAMGDDIMWRLQWGRLLVELALCAGPAAAKLILDLIKAKK